MDFKLETNVENYLKNELDILSEEIRKHFSIKGNLYHILSDPNLNKEYCIEMFNLREIASSVRFFIGYHICLNSLYEKKKQVFKFRIST